MIVAVNPATDEASALIRELDLDIAALYPGLPCGQSRVLSRPENEGGTEAGEIHRQHRRQQMARRAPARSVEGGVNEKGQGAAPTVGSSSIVAERAEDRRKSK